MIQMIYKMKYVTKLLCKVLFLYIGVCYIYIRIILYCKLSKISTLVPNNTEIVKRRNVYRSKSCSWRISYFQIHILFAALWQSKNQSKTYTAKNRIHFIWLLMIHHGIMERNNQYRQENGFSFPKIFCMASSLIIIRVFFVGFFCVVSKRPVTK